MTDTFLTRRMRYKTIAIDQLKMQRAAEQSKKLGVVNEELGGYIVTLVDNIVYSSHFEFRVHQEDMFNEFRQIAILHCIEQFNYKFNIDRSTAFAFFTTAIMNKLRDLFRSLVRCDYLGEYRGIAPDSNDGRKREKARVVYIEDSSSNKGRFR